MLLRLNLLRRLSCGNRPTPFLFRFHGTQQQPLPPSDAATADPPLSVSESPELPNWVKFSDHRPSTLPPDDDEDFVLPKIADWANTQKLHDCNRREAKLLVRDIVDGDIELVSRVLKRRFSTPIEVAAALTADVGEVELSEELVVKALRRFSNDWVPAFGFFTWAKTQTGYVHSANCYDMMVDVLGKCRKFELLQEVLEEMNGIGGLVSMATIIKMMRRFCKAGKWEDAVELFKGMEERFGLRKDTYGLNILMDALMKGKSIENAQKVFDEFTDSIPPDLHTFNVMIHGYCRIRELGKAKEVMEMMKKRGFVPSVVSYTCFIEAHCREKDFRSVDRVMDEMEQNGCAPSVVTYTVIMHALGKSREINEALEVYEKMKRNNCAPDSHFCSSLIYILCKSGRYKDAREVFDNMETHNLTPDVLTYKTMISAACQHSREEEALGLLIEMENRECVPNVETYAPLLKMCCRKKWMKVLKLLLNDMFRKGVCIDLGTYTLLVIALCNSGKLELACSFLEECVLKGMILKDSAYELLVKKLEEKGMEKAKQEMKRLMSQVKPAPTTT